MLEAAALEAAALEAAALEAALEAVEVEVEVAAYLTRPRVMVGSKVTGAATVVAMLAPAGCLVVAGAVFCTVVACCQQAGLARAAEVTRHLVPPIPRSSDRGLCSDLSEIWR